MICRERRYRIFCIFSIKIVVKLNVPRTEVLYIENLVYSGVSRQNNEISKRNSLFIRLQIGHIPTLDIGLELACNASREISLRKYLFHLLVLRRLPSRASLGTVHYREYKCGPSFRVVNGTRSYNYYPVPVKSRTCVLSCHRPFK